MSTRTYFTSKVQRSNTSDGLRDTDLDVKVEKHLPTLPYTFEKHGPKVIVSQFLSIVYAI